jgi:Lysozyme like domain
VAAGNALTDADTSVPVLHFTPALITGTDTGKSADLGGGTPFGGDGKHGGTYTYAQLKGIWLAAAKGTQYDSNEWASLMAAIAEAESGGNADATNPTDNGGTQTSWGLWQISLGNHAEPSPDWNVPAENARLAIGKLDGQGLDAWGTYTSGAYRPFLNEQTTAAG